MPRRNIFPLPEQFTTVPGMALRCHLAYVKPSSSTSTDADSKEAEIAATKQAVDSWSTDSVERFVQIAGVEKTLEMHIVKGRLADLVRR